MGRSPGGDGQILERMETRRVPSPLAWARAHPLAADALLGALLAVVSLIALVFQARNEHLPPPGPLAVALVLLTSLPLAWRRRHPLGVNLAVGAAAVAYGIAPFPDLVTPVPLGGVVALYSMVAWCDRRAAVTVGVLTAVAVVVIAWLPGTNTDLLDFSFTTLLLASAWVLGDSVRIRRAYTAELEARAAWLARERDYEARRAVTAERARIARELHDVIAHHVSMMVVQAEAGPVMVERGDPAGETRAFDTIAGIGRQALVEMRRLLGVLRSEAGGPRASLAPQPGMAQLPSLVDQVRRAGLQVDLVVEGEPAALPAGVDLSAYRIVQEALTNAVKHAARARVRVLVCYGERDLRLEVCDDGPGAALAGWAGPAGGNGAPGYGLIGMRERVHLFDGELTAGPGPHGGFTVTARLPIGGAR
jgi:signal transduction histidine kinase